MLSYIGGKSKIGKWIVDYYPTNMETYVAGPDCGDGYPNDLDEECEQYE